MKIWLRLTRRLGKPARKLRSRPILFVTDDDDGVALRDDRPGPPSRHAMQVWRGLVGTKEAVRACLAPAMELFCQLPFERFERYCPYGTPGDVAEFLAPYAVAGCREFNLIPQAPGHDYAIAGTAAVCIRPVRPVLRAGERPGSRGEPR